MLVRFNATASVGTPTAYAWSFGDGSFWNATGPGAATPAHEYEQPGEYNASVNATESGCSEGASVTLAAVAGPISVGCSASPTSGRVPLSVAFRCSASGGSGTYVSSLWTFGDGGTGTGFSVVYTYAHPGRYTAILNVSDSRGHWSLATVEVDAEAPPAASSDGELGLSIEGWAVLAAAVAVVGVALYFARRPSSPRGIPRSPGSEPPPALAPSRPAEPAAILPAPPEPPASGPEARPRPRPPADALRLTERVVLHLTLAGRLDPNDVATPSRTQAGMAETLGVGQNSLTNVLRRLEAADVVWHEVRHVAGRPRRLKVYGLTGRGEALGRELRLRRERVPSRERSGASPEAPPSQR